MEVIQHIHPDLILLDILMPESNGFDTCHRLKSDPETQGIPIIFMTALSDTIDKIKGFEAGAVDYITKPFHQEEVLARVKNHLALQDLRRQLQTQNAQLEEQNRLLQAEIAAHTRTSAALVARPSSSRARACSPCSAVTVSSTPTTPSAGASSEKVPNTSPQWVLTRSG